MKKITLWDNNNSIAKEYVINEEKGYGVTALGYVFTDKATNREIYVHPSMYFRIEIEEINV